MQLQQVASLPLGSSGTAPESYSHSSSSRGPRLIAERSWSFSGIPLTEALAGREQQVALCAFPVAVLAPYL